MARSSLHFITLVGAHTLLVVAHAWAHTQLGIPAPLWHNIYIGVVIIAAPLVAAGLLIRGFSAAGTWLLMFAMLGAFLFGTGFHFVFHTPDHVHAQPSTSWGAFFRATAAGLALVEGATTAYTAWRLYQVHT